MLPIIDPLFRMQFIHELANYCQCIYHKLNPDTICNAPDCIRDYRLTLQANTSLFSILWPHLHAFRETSQKVTHPRIAPRQARLTVEFL